MKKMGNTFRWDRLAPTCSAAVRRLYVLEKRAKVMGMGMGVGVDMERRRVTTNMGAGAGAEAEGVTVPEK